MVFLGLVGKGEGLFTCFEEIGSFLGVGGGVILWSGGVFERVPNPGGIIILWSGGAPNSGGIIILWSGGSRFLQNSFIFFFNRATVFHVWANLLAGNFKGFFVGPEE